MTLSLTFTTTLFTVITIVTSETGYAICHWIWNGHIDKTALTARTPKCHSIFIWGVSTCVYMDEETRSHILYLHTKCNLSRGRDADPSSMGRVESPDVTGKFPTRMGMSGLQEGQRERMCYTYCHTTPYYWPMHYSHCVNVLCVSCPFCLQQMYTIIIWGACIIYCIDITAKYNVK